VGSNAFVTNLAAWKRLPVSTRRRLLGTLYAAEKHVGVTTCPITLPAKKNSSPTKEALLQAATLTGVSLRGHITSSTCLSGVNGQPCTADAAYGFAENAEPIVTGEATSSGGADYCVFSGLLCSGALFGQAAWSGGNWTVLTLGAAGFAQGQLQEAQTATYTSQAPVGQSSRVTVTAQETMIDLDVAGGVASAGCFPTAIGLFVNGVAASNSPDHLTGCLDTAQIDALLPDIKVGGALEDVTSLLSNLKDTADLIQNALATISLGQTLATNAGEDLTAPPSDDLTNAFHLSCDAYDAMLFGASLVNPPSLPACVRTNFAARHGTIKGGTTLTVALVPQMTVKYGGVGMGLHILVGIPTVLVHECWPASECTKSTAPAPPAITTFQSSSQTLTSDGGLADLSATVRNATTCRLSVTPAMQGLPSTVDCSSGTADFPISLPSNSTATPEVYSFTLSAAGAPSTTPASATTTVTVDAPSSFGTCTFASTGPSVPNEPYPSSIAPNANGYSCIVAVDNNGGQGATSTADWNVTISFAPPMQMSGVTYENGLAVVTQTDTNSSPDPGNTNTVTYQIGQSGIYSAVVGVDDATTNQGGDMWGSETYSTSPDLDVVFSLEGQTVASEAFTELGQTAAVSFPVTAGDQLVVSFSNVDAESRGASSEPGQVDIVNPTITPLPG
jgi:hypothetical protein